LAELFGFAVEGAFYSFIVTAGVVLASIVAADVFIVLLDRIVRPITAKTKSDLDDLLFEAVRGPIKLFAVIFGAYYAISTYFPGLSLFGAKLDEVFVIFLIAAIGHTVAKAVNVFVFWYNGHLVQAGGKTTKDVFPLARKIITVAIYVATLLVVLPRMGIEITPLLASLGIAGLAVALALQDSLKNFFAGLYLLADKPVRSGEFIALDSDQSRITGFVEEVGWRSTRVRTLGNYSYVIPNERLASSIIANFSRGQGRWAGVGIDVGVAYSSDVEKVKRLLCEAVKNASKTTSAIDSGEAPVARVESFGDSSLNFKLLFRVHEYSDQLSAAGAVREEIFRLFNKNGVEIPFPTRVVHSLPANGKR
jgi:small-conductance mechanosensitive channel